jgi:hypothetical protein
MVSRICAFDADAAAPEDADGDPEPARGINGPATVLDLVPPKLVMRA